jgi:AraC family transcriptional regulator, positive regulator of tynA and feaB
VHCYSTSDTSRGEKLSYWNALHDELFSPLEVKPIDREAFEARVSCASLGEIGIVETWSLPAVIEHLQRHVVRTSDRQFYLLMPTKGQVALSHCGRQTTLLEGDMALLDSAAPYRISFTQSNVALGLRISPDALRAHMPASERLCGLRVRGDSGLGTLASGMLRGIWTQVLSGVPADLRPVITRSLLQVVSAAYAMEYRTEVEESSVPAARRMQIKRYIEAHLRDSGLNTNAIASSLGLSPRYLRFLFAAEGESVSSYIQRRRLEECARQLSDCMWRGRSITQIAFDWGFASMPHFTRAFREVFGVTPTAYRREGAALAPRSRRPA